MQINLILWLYLICLGRHHSLDNVVYITVSTSAMHHSVHNITTKSSLSLFLSLSLFQGQYFSLSLSLVVVYSWIYGSKAPANYTSMILHKFFMGTYIRYCTSAPKTLPVFRISVNKMHGKIEEKFETYHLPKYLVF